MSLTDKGPLAKAYPKELKTIGDHLRKRRRDLRLLQKDVAQRIGVDKTSIFYWESNRIWPRIHYIPKIIEFLGYVPFETEAETLEEKTVSYRRLHGITQKELAKSLVIDPGTLGRWERNEGRPLGGNLVKVTAFLNPRLPADAEPEG